MAGAKVLDACGVEHVIRAMRHGYVQCSRIGCDKISNYRRKELQLLTEPSDDKESRSSTSEMGQKDFLDRDVADQEMDLEQRVMGADGPDQKKP